MFNEHQINCEEHIFWCRSGSSETFGTTWEQFSAELLGGCDAYSENQNDQTGDGP